MFGRLMTGFQRSQMNKTDDDASSKLTYEEEKDNVTIKCKRFTKTLFIKC